MYNRVGLLSVSAFLLLLPPSSSLAQTGNGGMQGTVKDSAGAVVPKAKVVVTHTATSREYSSETNEVGFYLFPAMQSGAYQISGEMAGMETWKGNLTLAAGQVAAVDTILKPGSTATFRSPSAEMLPRCSPPPAPCSAR